MYCFTCQKNFKTKKAYIEHSKSQSHKNKYTEYTENKHEFRSALSKKFLKNFHSFITQTQTFTEVNALYKMYIAKNKYRLEGTEFKNVEEAIDALKDRICVKNDEQMYVKSMNKTDIVRRKPSLDLNFSFAKIEEEVV